NAASLHSSSHAGSSCLAEMSRTTASLSPLGAMSVSSAVTNPYWYSRSTSSSIPGSADMTGPTCVVAIPFLADEPLAVHACHVRGERLDLGGIRARPSLVDGLEEEAQPS